MSVNWNCSNLLYCISENPMKWWMGYALCKSSFSTDYCDWKVTVIQQIPLKTSCIEYQQNCEIVHGMHGEVHLQPYINEVLLWIIMSENWNCPQTFNFRNIFGTIHEIPEKVHLCSYANQNLLWTSMAVNRCCMNYKTSLQRFRL
jgi:hypothetical protein